MRKKLKFLLLAFVWLSLGSSYAQERAFSQKKAHQVHHLGLSLPMIWNNSSAVSYSRTSRLVPEGSALSYGVNISYSISIYKGIFGMAGFGYFNQIFGIEKPFDYETNGPEPIISSKSYAYNTLHYFTGIGYKLTLNQKFSLRGQATYNLYHSFRQRYTPMTDIFGGNQINKNSLRVGKMVNLHIEAERRLTQRLSFGLGLILPVFVEWESDSTFFRMGRPEDITKIAYNKFSIGTHFFCNYHF